MTDPTYAAFKRKEREFVMKHERRIYATEYQPIERRSRRRFSWERFAWLVCGSFALVETVYQVCLKVLR